MAKLYFTHGPMGSSKSAVAVLEETKIADANIAQNESFVHKSVE